MKNYSMTKSKLRNVTVIMAGGILCAVIALGTGHSGGSVKATTQKTTVATPSVAEARAETVYVKADSYRQELARRQEEAKAQAEEARKKAEEEARQRAEEEKRKAEERKQADQAGRQQAVQKQSVTSRRRSSVQKTQVNSVHAVPVKPERKPVQETPQLPAGVRYSWTTHGSTQDDINNGHMVRYYDNFYAADITTAMGKQICSLKQGDVIMIDGRKVEIDGEVYCNYRRDTLEMARKKIEATGHSYDSVCFQTCVMPYDGSVVIEFGHYV